MNAFEPTEDRYPKSMSGLVGAAPLFRWKAFGATISLRAVNSMLSQRTSNKAMSWTDLELTSPGLRCNTEARVNNLTLSLSTVGGNARKSTSFAKMMSRGERWVNSRNRAQSSTFLHQNQIKGNIESRGTVSRSSVVP